MTTELVKMALRVVKEFCNDNICRTCPLKDLCEPGFKRGMIPGAWNLDMIEAEEAE